MCLVTQWGRLFATPQLLGSTVHGGSPGKNTGGGCHALLQGIFPTQGPNPGLPQCKWMLYCLSHRGSPRTLEWVVYPFSKGSSWHRNQTGVSCIPGGFFTSWVTREAPRKITEGVLSIRWLQLLRSMGEGEGGMIWENSIETCILSNVKQIASPGWMHETSAQGWYTGMTQRDGMGMEVGGGLRMGTHVNPWLIHVNVYGKTTTIT